MYSNDYCQPEKRNTRSATGWQNEKINYRQPQPSFPYSYESNKLTAAHNNHTHAAPERTEKSDIFHSQTVGVQGPVLVQDTVLHETLETFVFSTTRPRRLHVKGYGAFGYFYTTHSMSEYTKVLRVHA